MKAHETPATHYSGEGASKKPHFRPAKDDSKPLLQDPIVRSDPIQTEESVLRLPPLPDRIELKSRDA